MQHILIASDGSDYSNVAVEHGLTLAKKLNAKVSVVCVSEDWTGLEIAADVRLGVEDPIGRFKSMAQKIADRVLEVAENAANTAGVSVDLIHVPNNHPADGIIATAKKQGCSMIVMGSHGRRALKSVFLGSVAIEVVARSTIPVLICK